MIDDDSGRIAQLRFDGSDVDGKTADASEPALIGDERVPICIECEQCVVVCPLNAVFLDLELPDQYLKAEADNAAFFRETKDEVEQLSYHTAMEMIHEAEAYARRMGHRVSVVVVDGSGIPIAMSRMDGATPWSTELALNKAYTATLYSINTDTSRLAPTAMVKQAAMRMKYDFTRRLAWARASTTANVR